MNTTKRQHHNSIIPVLSLFLAICLETFHMKVMVMVVVMMVMVMMVMVGAGGGDDGDGGGSSGL